MNIVFRPYQSECIEIIDSQEEGAFLVQMATGLGKTVVGANIKRRGRMLWLSHRDELVRQPQKYFDCSFGIEKAKEISNGEEVVSASVQSIINRLDKFSPDEFDILITDECHHAASTTYKKVYEHFNPRLHIGFTATPNRPDNIGLDTIYSDIIFQRDIKWGIENGYLSGIICKRVQIGYNVEKVKTRLGDFAPGELDEAMAGTEDAIAQAYREHAKGATLIFACSVRHAEKIAEKIEGAVSVTGETKNRADIISKFTNGEIPCITSVGVFTEGTDIPKVETVIMARPTKSSILYTQSVGRGLRLSPEKENLILIDCVGVTGSISLCSAPTLLGIDLDNVPNEKRVEIEGDIFELPDIVVGLSDSPESWIKNIKLVDIWAKKSDLVTHNVNWFKMPNGDLILKLPDKIRFEIKSPDKLGFTIWMGNKVQIQRALDQAFILLKSQFQDYSQLWDLTKAKRWGKAPATDSQKKLISRRLKTFNTDGLTKLEASQMLNRLFEPKSKK
jgi:type I site-specific restriction endonuclease